MSNTVGSLLSVSQSVAELDLSPAGQSPCASWNMPPVLWPSHHALPACTRSVSVHVSECTVCVCWLGGSLASTVSVIFIMGRYSWEICSLEWRCPGFILQMGTRAGPGPDHIPAEPVADYSWTAVSECILSDGNFRSCTTAVLPTGKLHRAYFRWMKPLS